MIALESDPACCKTAGELFSELSFDNAVLVEGNLKGGWENESPYDVIFIDGMVSSVPDELFNQLSWRPVGMCGRLEMESGGQHCLLNFKIVFRAG